MQAYFVLGTLLDALNLASVTRKLLGLPVSSLHGMVASMCTSNIFSHLEVFLCNLGRQDR